MRRHRMAMERVVRGLCVVMLFVTMRCAPVRTVHGEDPGSRPVLDGVARTGARILSAVGRQALEDRRWKDAADVYERIVGRLRALRTEVPLLGEALHNLGGAFAAMGQSQRGLELAKEGLTVTRRHFPKNHGRVGRAAGTIGALLQDVGRSSDAIPYLQAAAAVWRAKGDDDELITVLSALADCHAEHRRVDLALALTEEALATADRVGPGDDPRRARALRSRAQVLMAAGRPQDGLQRARESVAMYRRLAQHDNPHLLAAMVMVATAQYRLGQLPQAVSCQEDVVRQCRRLYAGDHPYTAGHLALLASFQSAAGQHEAAADRATESLNMQARLSPRASLNQVIALNARGASCVALGQFAEALSAFEEARSVVKRVAPGGHPIQINLESQTAYALDGLGRSEEALVIQRRVVRVYRRILPAGHAELATALTNLARIHLSLGQYSEALPVAEEARAMFLSGKDLPQSEAATHGMVATIYEKLGRTDDAYRVHAEALDRTRSVFGDSHPDTVIAQANLCKAALVAGRRQEALEIGRTTLEAASRLAPEHALPKLLAAANLGAVLRHSKQWAEAARHQQAALDLARRVLHPAHPSFLVALLGAGEALAMAGKTEKAVALLQEAVDLSERTAFAEAHLALTTLAAVHEREGRRTLAIPLLERACDHLEHQRVRAAALSPHVRGELISAFRHGSDPFFVLTYVYLDSGQPAKALGALERGRGRELLELLAQGNRPPLQHALTRAQARGEDSLVQEIRQAQQAVDVAEASLTAARKTSEQLGLLGRREPLRQARQAEADARRTLRAALQRRRAALREGLPEGRPLSGAEIQASLAPGERLLAYAVDVHAVYVFLVSPAEIRGHRLRVDGSGVNAKTLTAAVSEYVARLAEPEDIVSPAASHPGRQLAKMLMPVKWWDEIRKARRLVVVPGGALHRLPFEALVVHERAQNPVYWVDVGPPVVYAASASVLKWLRARPTGKRTNVVAVADPAFNQAARWPKDGVVILSVAADSQAAQAGLRRGDVLTSWDGQVIRTVSDLQAARHDSGEKRVSATVDREGATRTVMLDPGPIGVRLSDESVAKAGPKLQKGASDATGMLRASVVRGSLRRLPATKDEIEALRRIVQSARPAAKVHTLVDAAATEAALFAAVDAPRILHLATHGLVKIGEKATETALALTPARTPVPGNDGFLSLGDLFERWQGKLAGTELVVLSACESQTGAWVANEGMFALPWGFCFAGARAAVASLWRVEDQGTATLMAAFYARMYEEDGLRPCESLHQARRDIKRTHPSPYYWAPFVFVGAP